MGSWGSAGMSDMYKICDECPHPLRCDAAGYCEIEEGPSVGKPGVNVDHIMKWIAVFFVGGIVLLAWLSLR